MQRGVKILNKTTKDFLLPSEKWQTLIYILYDVADCVFGAKIAAFCICNSLAGCFSFFLLLHYFLETFPAFSFWQHIYWCFRAQRLDVWLWLMALVWVGSSGTAWACFERWLYGAAHQLGSAARACTSYWDKPAFAPLPGQCKPVYLNWLLNGRQLKHIQAFFTMGPSFLFLLCDFERELHSWS